MNLHNLSNQFLAASDTSREDRKGQPGRFSNKVSNLANAIPGGLDIRQLQFQRRRQHYLRHY